MPTFELLLISIARAIVEVAGFSLLGQGLLALFAGRSRDQNVVYRLLQIVTAPVIKAARIITPRLIVDRHIPLVAFFLLFWLWIGLALAKRYVCHQYGLDCFG